MLVERAAQFDQPHVVRWVEKDVAGGQHRTHDGITARSRPRSEFGIASVMTRSAKRLIRLCGPSKLTQRLLSVLPASCRGLRFAGRSMSTRCVLPTIDSEMARAWALSLCWSKNRQIG